jgi:hypothetical protein
MTFFTEEPCCSAGEKFDTGQKERKYSAHHLVTVVDSAAYASYKIKENT